MSEGIYSRAKKHQVGDKQPLEKHLVSTQVQEELELVKDARRQIQDILGQLEKAQPMLKDLQEVVQMTKLVKAAQTDTRDLDKVERDTLIMFQTYLKMQGVVQPS